MEEKRVFDTERLIPTYFRMALPVVFSMVITLVYNLADTFFIARTNDAMLVAGVSFLGYILAGFVQNAWIVLSVSLAAMTGVLLLIKARQKN